jgi:ATP-dependent DNA helicase DinG
MLAISMDMAALCASIGAALSRRSGATDSFTGSEPARLTFTAPFDPAGLPDLPDAAAAALADGGKLAGAWPGFRPRAGQQALAASVARAIAERGTLVAEAGTGTGKTFAYLVPLLLAGGKALISTGTRHLQDQLHGRDLPAVRAALGVPVRTALLKGRANYVCHHHLARHLTDGRFTDPGVPQALRRIRVFAQHSESGDRADCAEVGEDDPAWGWATSTRENCLGQECPELKQCFVFRARREALAADVVVVNHHLFCADLALRDEAVAELLPVADAVIFDEAHQLPDTATAFFGDAVSTRQLLDLARDLVRSGLVGAPDGADWRALADRLERSTRELRLVLEGPAVPVRGRAAARPSAMRRLGPEQLHAMPLLDETLDTLLADLVSVSAIVATNAGRSPDLDRCGLRAGELCERLQRWSVALGGPPWPDTGDDTDSVGRSDGSRAAGTTEPPGPRRADPEPAIVWVELGAQYATLRRTPLSVAGPFERHRAGPPRAWVFVSATLSLGTDFSHFTDALGLADARCERWESPFDFPQQAAVWIPRGVGDTATPGHAARVVEAAWPLIVENRGRAFVLCTTLRAMRDAAQRLAELDSEAGSGLQLLVQGESSRAVLLERFRAAAAPVLVGSAGFWEGVDVAGDRLSLVIIDKLPFAPPDDPVVKARAEALRREGRDPFGTLHLPAAALALKQGAGRLIRSEDDRGVLVLGDERLLTRGYGRLLLRSLPPFTRVEHWQDARAYLPGPVSATPPTTTGRRA